MNASSTTETADQRARNLQARVTAILTKPAAEWPIIAGEATDVTKLYKEYIVLLAAVPAVALFLGMSVIGVPFFGRLGMGGALSTALGSYISTLVATFIAAIVVEKLAPTFNSSGDTTQALKLVAYASTPVWVAGVVYLFVVLAPIMLLAALYAIYLFYLGVGPVMKTPKEKVVPYMIVSAIVVIVVNVCLRLIVGALVPGPTYGF
jgi:hypothetical protein